MMFHVGQVELMFHVGEVELMFHVGEVELYLTPPKDRPETPPLNTQADGLGPFLRINAKPRWVWTDSPFAPCKPEGK